MDQLLEMIVGDPDYQANLDWGHPRPGHPEGTVRAHIRDLEANLHLLRDRLSSDAPPKLRVLIHVHDSFKAQARRGVPIVHEQSHASLARAFLERFCADQDLLAMVQYHDEGYALWKAQRRHGRADEPRLRSLLGRIQDWNLFLALCVLDGCTGSKDRTSLRWFLNGVGQRIPVRVTPEWVDELDRRRQARGLAVA